MLTLGELYGHIIHIGLVKPTLVVNTTPTYKNTLAQKLHILTGSALLGCCKAKEEVFVDIDYVIAWVDGNDPRHVESRRVFPPDQSLVDNEEAVGDIRYADSGEIYFNIASVLQFASFVRRIFVVTDNQEPKLLDRFFQEGKCKADFIKLVSHDEIFKGLKVARPNFSSLSIESALWRIPGLSEHFVYANDDFFINANIEEDDWFRGNHPCLHGRWAGPERKRFKNVFRRVLRRLAGIGPNVNPTFRKSQDAGAIVAGSKDGFLAIGHHPHPMRKSTIEAFFKMNPDILERQLSFRYRCIEQFNPVSLANYLEIVQNQVSFRKPRRLAYFDPRKRRITSSSIANLTDTTIKFGCVQGLELMDSVQRKALQDALCAKFAKTLPEAIISHFNNQPL